jgi:hypothetical protein
VIPSPGHPDVGDHHIGADLVLRREEPAPIPDRGDLIEFRLDQSARLSSDPA